MTKISEKADSIDLEVKGIQQTKHVKSNEAFEALHEINRHLKNLNKTKAVSSKEMKVLSTRAWKVHAAYDHKIKQLEQQKKHLKNQVNLMWKNLATVLFPVMEVDSTLLPLYNDLTNILNCLEALINNSEMFVSQDAKDCALVLLQDRLHKIEQKRVEGVFLKEGVTSLVNAEIPSGQAICATLLSHCYRLIAKIQSLETCVTEPPSKLDDLNHSLTELLTCLKAGFDFSPSYLDLMIEEAHLIESHEKDGVFVEDDGSVAPNQEYLRKQIDLTHDLINECILSYEEDAVAPSSKFPSLDEISAQLEQARGQLVDRLDYLGDDFGIDFSAIIYDELITPAKKAIVYLEDNASEIAKSSYKQVSSMVQSVMGLASKLQSQHEPVDPELKHIHDELKAIVSNLKKVRNKMNLDRVRKGVNDESIPSEVTKILEGAESKLKAIGEKRKEGLFVSQAGIVGKGQEVLATLFSQCQALIKSISGNN